MKRAVFTVLFGNYDDINHLLEFEIKNQLFDIFIITDKKLPLLSKSPIIQIVVKRRFDNTVTESRYYKFNVFEVLKSEEYIYFDANRRLNHQILSRIFDIGGRSNVDIVHFYHPKNINYSQEVHDCSKQNKLTGDEFDNYLNNKDEISILTDGVVLTENSIFYFRNKVSVKIYLNSIFGLYCCFVPRDQLSSLLIRSVVNVDLFNIEFKSYDDVGFDNIYYKHKKKMSLISKILSNLK
jgi:hypothetical protein